MQSNLFSFRVKQPIFFCRVRVVGLSMDGLRFLYKVWVIRGRIYSSVVQESMPDTSAALMSNFGGLSAAQDVSDTILSEFKPT